METYSLHPEYMTYVIVFALIPASILQWVVIGIFLPSLKVSKSLDNRLKDLEVVNEDIHKIPFFRDGFFILWNLLPIIALIIYCSIWYNWEEWMHRCEIVFEKQHVHEAYEHWIYGIHFGWVVIIAMLSVSMLGGGYQVLKQKSHMKHGRWFYWWDWRISRIIFVTRLALLIVNFFTFGFMIVSVARILLFMNQMISISDISPVFLHPDGHFGFAFIGEMCLFLVTLLVFVAGMSLTGFIDHRGQGRISYLGDLALFCVSVGVSFWLLLWPSYKLSEQFDDQYGELSNTMNVINAEILEDFQEAVESNDEAEVSRWIEENSTKVALASEISSFEISPFSQSLLLTLFTTFTLPLILWGFLKTANGRINNSVEEETDDD